MNPQRLVVRFALVQPPADLQPAITMFHRFIQRGLVEGLVLDVADYRHVPQGPGVVLVGHDVDYGLDPTGFQVTRKRQDAPAADQLRDVLRMALGTMDTIVADGEVPVEFDRGRFTVAVLDRRLGTPTEVAPALLDELAPVLTGLFGAEAKVTVVSVDDPREPATLAVEADPASAAGALEALGGAAPPMQSPWDVTTAELQRLREDGEEHVLLDVREASEFEQVNLDGRLVPLGDLDDRVAALADELGRDTRVVVHCRAGSRGAKAVVTLREAGFTDAWNLNGGLMAWIDDVDASLPKY